MVASSESTMPDNSSPRFEGDFAGVEVQRYRAEMQLVHTELETMVDALEGPLRSLVRSQVRATMPPVRAAIALASGVNDDAPGPGEVQGADELRRQRIHLAIALEMLTAALNTHRLLILGDAADLDKSVLGGTILAGDYCFSRSADMAVKTDSPRVVAIFATALKSVSEGSLRHLFEERKRSGRRSPDLLDAESAFDENEILYHTAVAAAAVLTNASEEVTRTLYRLSSGLVDAQRSEVAGSAYAKLTALTAALPIHAQVRWRLLLAWVAADQGDGDIRPFP